MFNFGKKKDREQVQVTNSGNSVTSTDASVRNAVAAIEANQGLPIIRKSADPPLSQEEVQHLEETKHRLFNFGKKPKPLPVPPSSEISMDNGVTPILPPRLSKLSKSRPAETPPVPPKPAAGTVPFSHTNGNGHQQLRSRDSHGSSSSTQTEPDALMNPSGEAVGFSQSLKNFTIPGLKLPALEPTLLVERYVTVPRQSSGDFGFSIRRAQLVMRQSDSTEVRETVIFAEPVQAGQANRTGLLPGDQLVEVNGVIVTHMTRDDIIALIRNSGDSVVLKVCPVPELVELSMRSSQDVSDTSEPADVLSDARRGDLQLRPHSLARTGSKRKKASRLRACGDAAEQAEKFWLAHQGGYAAALLVGSGLNEGKVMVQLSSTGDQVEVDRDDVEKANAPEQDRCEDLKDLVFLNECSVLHVLRQRYGSSLVHTYAGSQNTVIVAPHCPLSVYSEKVVQMFKGCKREDMPPHIYAVAQQMYRAMQATRRNQSVVFMGRSGSGKSTQMKHLLQYLCLVSGSVGKLVTIEKLNAIIAVLEAFGNCRTYLNVNASRFASIVSLDFDHVGQVSAAFVQCLMLECSRVVRRPPGESNFHVFYYLWEGADQELRNELQLTSVDDPSPLFTGVSKPVDQETCRQAFLKLLASLDVLKVSSVEMKVIWSILGAILHLACAGATKGLQSFKCQFQKTAHAQKAASLLGVGYDELVKTVFHAQFKQEEQRQIAKDGRRSSSERKQSLGIRASLEMSSVTDRVGDGQEALDAFVIGLYKELFSLIVSLVNRSLASNYRTLNSITVVDCPGFQNPSTVKGSPRQSANFEEFCFNYAQERLHGLFHDATFTAQMEIYQQENVEIDFEDPALTPHQLIAVIDKPSQQNLIRSTNIELRSQEKRGLLWLLDEESLYPGASDESFLERIFVHHGDMKDLVLKRSKQHNHFLVRHCLGTNAVVYNAAGWLKIAQENPVTRLVLPLLQESQKDSISTLFLTLRAGAVPGVAGTIGGMESSRRMTSIQRTLGAGLKRKSVCAMVKAQMDYVVDMLKRTTRTQFVHCFLPQHETGLRVVAEKPGEDLVLNVPLLRSQVRGLQLLDAIRINKIGYPERMPFAEFRRRFECLVSGDYKPAAVMLDDRQTVAHLLDALEVDRTQVQLGHSQIFLRSDLMAQLEDRRDDAMFGFVAALQAECRGYLARKNVEKRKVQQMAIKCIQKNIRKYVMVKMWPWWRLYTRVLPLLDVNRTDAELKNQAEEIETLRAKLERLEKSHAELRAYCDRLESKLSDSQAELQDERTQATQATSMLELENVQKTRLEKELGELQAKHEALVRSAKRSEMELMEYRNLKAILPEDDVEDELVYKDRYEQLKRQLEAQKRQFEQERQEELSLHQQVKRQMDKRVHDSTKEAEECRQQLNESRRKAKHMADELQDSKLHNANVVRQNNELEKKQRKFDAELKSVQDLVSSERSQKERLLREKHDLSASFYLLEQELKAAREELDVERASVRRLQTEVDELTVKPSVGGGSSDAQLLELKHAKQALQQKCQDQEEELDDLAGQVQQLQQQVLKLEMQNERTRQEQQRQLTSKDEELEEARNQALRKVKSMEQQLEEEFEQKQGLLREKRELELKVRELADQQLVRDDAVEVQLRRDLRKTKALLRDAQLILHTSRATTPNRGLVKQLRNQLEDAEAEKLFALKQKQNLEGELDDLRRQLEAVGSAKAETEERVMSLLKDRNALESQLNEANEEVNDLLKKYKAQIQQGSVDHITLTDQIQQIADLEKGKESLKDQVTELHSKLKYLESESVDKHKLLLAESKVRDLEAKLEFELSAKLRLESQITRHKDHLDSVQNELASLRAARDKDLEVMKRLQRQVEDTHEAQALATRRDTEATARIRELEHALELGEQENQIAVADLKLALRRIDDLQGALETDLHSTPGSDMDSDDDSANVSDHEILSTTTRSISTASTTSKCKQTAQKAT